MRITSETYKVRGQHARQSAHFTRFLQREFFRDAAPAAGNSPSDGRDGAERRPRRSDERGFETRMDLLEQLGDVAVPEVPAAREFTAGVRRKLHPRLLALHVAEFALGATVWGARHMLVALFAAVVFTVTGSWPRAVKRLPPLVN